MLRKVFGVTISLVLALTVMSFAAQHGAGPQEKPGSPAKTPAATPQQPASTPEKPMGTDPGKSAGTDLSGQHSMTGEVTKIDAKKGTVSVKTSEGELDLRFPPSALTGIKKGDRVEVQLALRHANSTGSDRAPSQPPAAGKAPSPTKPKQ